MTMTHFDRFAAHVRPAILGFCLLASVLAGCSAEPDSDAPGAQPHGNAPGTSLPHVELDEAWITARDTTKNVDSVTFWSEGGTEGGPADRHWLLATAKESDEILVHDALDGTLVRAVGGEGTVPGRFDRPNGILVVDSLVFVVERDNHRVQVLSLPDFRPLFLFGADMLVKPYGIAIASREDGYSVWVTDNYEFEEDVIPADSLLGRRIHTFHVTRAGAAWQSRHTGTFGDTEGEGVLRVVESITVDAAHSVLMIAEELETDSHLKVYGTDGTFSGQNLGRGLFPHQAEGIVLAECAGGEGYWIATDQAPTFSTFHVFDRTSFDHLGSFTGKGVANTDGIALTTQRMGAFEAGVFAAVHDDGNVAAYDWAAIADALGLPYGACG